MLLAAPKDPDFFFFCARESLVYFWYLRGFILFSSLLPAKTNLWNFSFFCVEASWVDVGSVFELFHSIFFAFATSIRAMRLLRVNGVKLSRCPIAPRSRHSLAANSLFQFISFKNTNSVANWPSSQSWGQRSEQLRMPCPIHIHCLFFAKHFIHRTTLTDCFFSFTTRSGLDRATTPTTDSGTSRFFRFETYSCKSSMFPRYFSSI